MNNSNQNSEMVANLIRVSKTNLHNDHSSKVLAPNSSSLYHPLRSSHLTSATSRMSPLSKLLKSPYYAPKQENSQVNQIDGRKKRRISKKKLKGDR